ncbi:MAG: FtsW/RodA/SpoVE family cell cycle protein [Tissierellia bacterium]|nr:FtsW/RodA/SpoVE family cell cycle protein [Tissierellia bacterium]
MKLKKSPRNLLLLFQILTIGLLFLFNIDHLDNTFIYMALGLMILVYASNFLVPRISNGDDYIFLIVTMLMTIGIVTVFRIYPSGGVRQLLWVFVGIVAFYSSYYFIKHVKLLKNMFWIYIVLGYLFFILTLVFGRSDYGSVNWIHIGSITIQLSELTKLLILLAIAVYYTTPIKGLETKWKPYIFMAIIYSYVGLLLLQRDLGTAAIMMGIYSGTQFVYEKNRKMWKLNILLMIVGALLGYAVFGHVRIRFAIWKDPWNIPEGYQILQSLFAIAAGGFFGTGLGEGHPYLIPKVQFDFIFPAICEEMGMFMGVAIILLFLLLVYRGMKIVLEQELTFYRVLALGVTLLFGIQAFVAIGGGIKFIPMTGITLPFVSYGGSSMLSSFIALAFLQVASEVLPHDEEVVDEPK